MSTFHVMTADDVVISLVAKQVITALLPQDNVITRVAINRVTAAGISIGGEDRGEHKRMILHIEWQQAGIDITANLSMIAEYQIIALSCRHMIIAGAADNQIIAHARINDIVSTFIGIRAADPVNIAGITIINHPVDITVITQNHICRITTVDRIISAAAQDDILTGTRTDRIISALIRIRRFHPLPYPIRQSEPSVITSDKVIAITGIYRIIPCAGKNDVILITGTDHIISAQRRSRGLQQIQRQSISISQEAGDSVITQYEILSSSGCDNISSEATEDQIIPGTGGNRVISSGIMSSGFNRTEYSLRVNQFSTVADDNIVSFTGINLISAGAAQNHIISRIPLNGIIPAIFRTHRFDLYHIAGIQNPYGSIALSNHSIVAQDDVIALAA